MIRRTAFAVAAALGSLFSAPALADGVAVTYPQYPSLSPDGRTVVFSWAGDLWAVDSTGGTTTRLTAHPADERRSLFSPDGATLIFESDRDGPRSIYTAPLVRTDRGIVAGEARRITFSDRPQELTSCFGSGTVLFTGGHEPSIYRQTRMYAVDIGGGPVRRLTNAFGALPRAAADGSRIVFTRGRPAWDRPRYRGSGAMDLWLLEPEGSAFTRLTTGDAHDGDGFPLPDGSIVFVSSRDGQNNIWRLAPGKAEDDAGALTQVTAFKPTPEEITIGHGVRDLAVSAEGGVAAFCVWDTLYTLDLRRAGAQPVALALYASADADTWAAQTQNLAREVVEAALSPDGKTIAVVARGEIFFRSTEEGRPTRRLTSTVGRERDLAWSPDNQFLYFASDEGGQYAIRQAKVVQTRAELLGIDDKKAEDDEDEAEEGEPEEEPADPPAPEDGAEAGPAPEEDADEDEEGEPAKKEKEPKIDHGARWADALRFETVTLLDSGAGDRAPVPSPDGRRLLYTRGRGDLMLRDLATGEDRTVFESWNAPDAVWCPDSRHIIYAVEDLDFNSDLWLLDLDADGAAPLNITRHPDSDASPRLSADGKVLYFLSDRDASTNGDDDVYRVYLDRALEAKTRWELDEYFKEAAKAAKKRKPIDTPDFTKPAERKPLTFDVDDSYLRISRVSGLPGSEGNLAVTPGADRVVFSATIDGKRNLYSLDHKAEDRQTVASGGAGSVAVSLTGEQVVLVKDGQAHTTGPTGGKTTTHTIDAQVAMDMRTVQRQKFREAARTLGEVFYHPTLKGLDWPRLTERYEPLAVAARTTDAFNRIVNSMFHELDGSHLGISGGPQAFSGSSLSVGYLGAETEPAPGGYAVRRIVRNSPADRPSSHLQPGDVIVSIDDAALAAAPDAPPSRDLAEALACAAGREVILEVRRAGAPEPVVMLIEPVSFGGYSGLCYEDECISRREAVDQLSGGRIGYLHIRGMSEPSVRTFERDLYAAAAGKDGLIIDVRDNGGGWTTDILLASLTAPTHAYTIPRGAKPEEVREYNYPRDRRLIYAYSRPIVVLINENSFSNAEIFAHSIKTTGRGRLIGTPTFGGVISTGAFRLIDGTSIRTPFRGWYLPDGTDMENHGAQPDVNVPITPADEAAGRDPQLEAAAHALLDSLEG